LEEGVENIESLAHHDLIDLMLKTRIPIRLIIDWYDQALLYLHSGQMDKERAITELRKFGVRTASDLISAAQNPDREVLKHVHGALGENPDGTRLWLLLTAIADADWMKNILYWRSLQRADLCCESVDKIMNKCEVSWPTRSGDAAAHAHAPAVV
jgi:hypothetical protein